MDAGDEIGDRRAAGVAGHPAAEDRPHRRGDETLLALARAEWRDGHSGITAQEIAKLPGYEARRHAPHAARWVEALAEARAAADAGTAPAEPARLSSEERERRKALEEAISALVARRAEELGISSELLLSRRLRDRALDAWQANGEGSLAESIGGFRGRLLDGELDALAAGGSGP